MKQPRIDNATRDQLFSTRSEIVLEAISKLSETGNHFYVPILFELLATQPEEEIKLAILKLLGTVKDKESIPEFIAALQNEHLKSIRKDIAMCCWQNGLDFSAHMSEFTELVISESWEVAFEAFTVIENLEHFPPEDELHRIHLRIAAALRTADEQKQYFLEEILRMNQ
jgi:hypothetical protein